MFVFTCTSSLVNSSLNAQDLSNPDPTSKAGVGISIFNFDLFQYDYFDLYQPAGIIYVPINVTEKFRIEPEISFFSRPGYGAAYLFSAGLGLEGMKRKNDFNMIYGVRMGVTLLDGVDDRYTSLGPILGGEHYFSKHFSIGAEIQLRGIYYDPDFYISTATSFQTKFYF